MRVIELKWWSSQTRRCSRSRTRATFPGIRPGKCPEGKSLLCVHVSFDTAGTITYSQRGQRIHISVVGRSKTNHLMCDNISLRIDRVLHVGHVDLVTRVSDVVFDRWKLDRQGAVIVVCFRQIGVLMYRECRNSAFAFKLVMSFWYSRPLDSLQWYLMCDTKKSRLLKGIK